MARQPFDPMAEYEIKPGAFPFEAYSGNIPAEIKAVDDGVIRAELGMDAADMDEQLDAILVQATAAAGSTGSGVHPCVWTVTDGTNTLQGAKVTFWLDGTLKGTGTTVEGGLVSMSLDPGVYDVAISRDGHVFAGATHEVTAASGTWTATFEMTTISITPSPAGFVTGYWLCYGLTGQPEVGTTHYLKVRKGPGTAGFSHDGTTREAVSDGNGLVQFTGIPHGASVFVWRGTSDSSKQQGPFRAPTTGSEWAMNEIVGTP